MNESVLVRRKTPTYRAVRWDGPEQDSPETLPASDDLCTAMDWPSGSRYVKDEFGVARVQPGCYILTDTETGVSHVVGAAYYQSVYEQV